MQQSTKEIIPLCIPYYFVREFRTIYIYKSKFNKKSPYRKIYLV